MSEGADQTVVSDHPEQLSRDAAAHVGWHRPGAAAGLGRAGVGHGGGPAQGQLLTGALRLLPDVLRLLRRLAADRSLPGGVRVRLWLLLGYLAIPVDLLPDFVPVLGYADDAIIVTWMLRSVVRRAGPHALRRHWPGSQDGLDALWRLCRLGSAQPHG